MSVRKERRDLSKFHGDHGLYFLFAREILASVAYEFNMREKDISLLLFTHYVTKYITDTRAINPSIVSLASKEAGLNYGVTLIKNTLAKFYAKDLVGKYGDVYVSSNDTVEFVKMFSNHLNMKIFGFSKITFEQTCNTRKRKPRSIETAERRREQVLRKRQKRKEAEFKKRTLARLRAEERKKQRQIARDEAKNKID